MNYQRNNFESGPMELEEPCPDSYQYYSTPAGCFAERYTPFNPGFYSGFESPRVKKPTYAYTFDVFPHHHQTPCIEALINDHKESRLRSPEYEPWYSKCNLQNLDSPTFQSVTPAVNRFENIAFENKNLFESPPRQQDGIDNIFANGQPNRNSPVFQSQEVNGFGDGYNPFENNQNNNFFQQQSSPAKPEDSLENIFSKEQPIIDQNPNQDNEGVETASPQGSDWGGEELWADVSHASFGNAQNVIDLGGSFSLNNDEVEEIPVDGLILNGLDEFSGIFDAPLEVKEEQVVVMTPKLPEMSEIDISAAHSEDYEGECLEKKLKLERTEIKQRVIPTMATLQDKWDNIPGKILKAVKRGCRYYYTRTQGIKLECVIRVLDNKAIEVQKKFEKFIAAYRPAEETWEAIVAYVSEKGDAEIAYILSELTYEFLSSREDLEMWMTNMPMSRKTKNYIRTTREIMKDTLIYYLYPRDNCDNGY